MKVFLARPRTPKVYKEKNKKERQISFVQTAHCTNRTKYTVSHQRTSELESLRPAKVLIIRGDFFVDELHKAVLALR